jgi:prevent-host-death family protein
MKTAAVSTLKAKLSEYLAAVKGGEEVIVTERGRPIARLGPIEGRVAEDERLSRLVARGLVRPGKGGGLRALLPSLRADRTDVPLEAILRAIREDRDGGE